MRFRLRNGQTREGCLVGVWSYHVPFEDVPLGSRTVSICGTAKDKVVVEEPGVDKCRRPRNFCGNCAKTAIEMPCWRVSKWSVQRRSEPDARTLGERGEQAGATWDSVHDMVEKGRPLAGDDVTDRAHRFLDEWTDE
jgi:hypothetical protein